MTEFLKDYFLSYFSNKRAKNIYKRSFIITFINVIVLFLSLFLTSFLSQEVSFKYLYNHSDNFKEVLCEVLPNDVVIENNQLVINEVYSSFDNDKCGFIDKGYYVVIDSRDPKTTFDDFTFVMIDESDNKINYEAYLLLEDNEKENYSALITRGGKYLDTVSNIALYESYLSNLEDKKAFEDAKTKYENGTISQLEYANTIYVLYGKSYYPEDVYTCDSYGGLPTLHSYYLSSINSLDNGGYVFLYNDGIEATMSSKGRLISFFGSYSKINKLDLTTDKETKVDTFVYDVYKSSKSLRSIAYLFISFFSWFISLIVFIIAVFVTRLILSFAHKNERHYTIKIMNLMGSFLLFSSVLSTIIFIFLGFTLSRNAIVVLSPIVTFLLVIIRTFIYYMIEKDASDVIKEE